MTTPMPPVDHMSEAESAFDLAALEELRTLGEGIGPEFLPELVDLFVHDTELLLIELREAVEVRDVDAVGRIAHNIKGSGGQLGARQLALSCSRLERAAGVGVLSVDQTDLHEVEMDYVELRLALRQQLSRWETYLGGSRD
jgi:HPt (histidine-containing phosphotransfer) domain-containing protein